MDHKNAKLYGKKNTYILAGDFVPKCCLIASDAAEDGNWNKWLCPVHQTQGSKMNLSCLIMQIFYVEILLDINS